MHYLNKKYHPKCFDAFDEFCAQLSIKNNSIEDYKHVIKKDLKYDENRFYKSK